MTNARYQLPARIDIDARALCSYYVKRDERVVDPDSSASYRLFFPTIDAVFRVGIPEMSDPMETPTSCEKRKDGIFLANSRSIERRNREILISSRWKLRKNCRVDERIVSFLEFRHFSFWIFSKPNVVLDNTFYLFKYSWLIFLIEIRHVISFLESYNNRWKLRKNCSVKERTYWIF